MNTAPRIHRFLARAAAVRRMLRHARRRRIALLMYHGVTREPLPVYNWCHMPLREFAEQMALLSAHYRVLPLDEVVERLAAGRPLPDRTACVTFDDGFRNNRDVALPVLKRHNMPFTVFVTTGLADTGRPPWPEEVFSAVIHTGRPAMTLNGRALSLASGPDRLSAYHAVLRMLKSLPPVEREAKQAALLRDLAAEGTAADPAFATLTWPEIAAFAREDLVRFGSHTQSHEILTLCAPERQREEMGRSRGMLRDRLGYCGLLAYPNGDHSADVRRLARELGYRAAVTATHRLNGADADLFALDRLGIGADLSAWQFEVKLLGW